MSTLRTKAVAAIGAAAALVAGGTAVASARTSADQGVVGYRVTSHATIYGPSHFRPGLVKFAVSGATGQSFQLAKTRHGAGRRTLVGDVGALNKGNPAPLERDFILIGGVETGNTAYLTLKPGTYYAVDTTPSNVTYDKVRVIGVSGTSSHAAGYPRSPAMISAIHEMSWAKTPVSIPTAGYLRFANNSTDSHFVVLAHIKKGKTIGDVMKAFKGQEPESAVLYSGPKDNFDNGVISPQRAETSTYSLNRGTYALMCFWPDRKTGMPHAFMGMIRSIHLR